MSIEPATIDEIVVFTSKKVMTMSNILKATKLDFTLGKALYKSDLLHDASSYRICGD